MIKEHLLNIDKIKKMALIDLKKIYKGAALGWFWIVAKPTVNLFIYWFLFAVGLKVGNDVNGYPYFIWLIVGLLPWFYISEIINNLPNSYRKYNYLVNKMKFPISIIPTFMSLSRFIVNLFLTLIVLIVYFYITKNININYASFVFYTIFMFLMMSVIGNIIALLSSLSKDIGNLIKTFQTPLLFLSPIFWNINTLNLDFIVNVQKFNPISYFVCGYRDVFINNVSFYDKPIDLFYMLLIYLILICINIILFKKLEKHLPDYL